MKKNIIITSGPTNERIDAVMKITNMSTGALGNVVAETFLEDKADEIDTIYYRLKCLISQELLVIKCSL